MQAERLVFTDNLAPAASRGNALKHGLTAAQVVIHGEDPTAYDAFRAQLIEEIAPSGSLETTLAHDLVATVWRLRRVPFLENAFLAQADTLTPTRAGI